MLIIFALLLFVMGIKERKEKHKEELKLKILMAAKGLFLKHGYEATSLRKIAEQIEISPTTIYLYYKDKSDIIYALHQEGFKLLSSQFLVLREVEDPFERLKAMGRIYMKFALENPDFYELMFIMKEPLDFVAKHCGSEWEEGEFAFNALLATVADCRAIGYFKQVELNSMALNIWATMHGLCSLKLQGHLDHVASVHIAVPEKSTLLDEAFESLVVILKSLR